MANFLSKFVFLNVVSLVVISSAAVAQETDRARLIDALLSRHSAAAELMSLYSVAARIVHVESVTLLSVYGDWPMDEALNWPKDAEASKFLYDVKNIEDRMTNDLADLRRAASRSRAFKTAEKEYFAQMVADVERMVEQSQTLYGLLLVGSVEEADQFFQDENQSTYLGVVGDSYTMMSGISGDIRDIKLQARKIE